MNMDTKTEAPVGPTDVELVVAGFLELIEQQENALAPRSRVVVQAYLPHVTQYNKHFDPLRDLVYRWRGGEPLAVGDLVLCPKTPLGPSDFVAIVVSLDASNHPYKGPVRSIIRKVTKEKA
jgi:hypothetical protein